MAGDINFCGQQFSEFEKFASLLCQKKFMFKNRCLFLILFIVALSTGSAFAQAVETASNLPETSAEVSPKSDEIKIAPKNPPLDFRAFQRRENPETFNPFRAPDKKAPNFNKAKITRSAKLSGTAPETEETAPETEEFSQTEVREKFHWKPALVQSLTFLTIQHSYRMTQEKTRRELGGPFFRDWAKSITGLRGWRDPDSFFINYVLHPLQGGLTGRIFVVNSDRARRQEFGKSKQYWESRFKAFIWSAAWSTQFEFGPLSEASLGNVGIREKRGRSTMAYVDLVVTPVLGTGVLIAEDAIDKYILRNWLEKKSRRLSVAIKILRSLLTPTTAFSNVLRGKVPWKRDNRY